MFFVQFPFEIPPSPLKFEFRNLVIRYMNSVYGYGVLSCAIGFHPQSDPVSYNPVYPIPYPTVIQNPSNHHKKSVKSPLIYQIIKKRLYRCLK